MDDAVPGGEDDGLRTCAVTRERLPPEALIRFVVSPDGRILPDLKRSLPGRGVWVTATRQRVEEAVRTKAFARSLRRSVEADSDLPLVVGRLLLKRALDALSIANKAGEVTTGFQAVTEALESGKVATLLHGREAGSDGRQKLDRLLARRKTAPEAAVLEDLFAVAELSLALGRPNVVHAALGFGGASKRFRDLCGRLQRYEGGCPAAQAGMDSRTEDE